MHIVKSNKITKNKAYELEIIYKEFEWTNFFKFNLMFNRKTDHAGLHFELEIMDFQFYFRIYDIRHWDYKNDNWEKM